MRPKKSANENEEQIGNLLAKYKRILQPPQASVEKACIDAVEVVTGFVLRPEQVSYSVPTQTLHLKIPSVLKSELKPKYQSVLQEMKKHLPEKSAPSVIL